MKLQIFPMGKITFFIILILACLLSSFFTMRFISDILMQEMVNNNAVGSIADVIRFDRIKKEVAKGETLPVNQLIEDMIYVESLALDVVFENVEDDKIYKDTKERYIAIEKILKENSSLVESRP